MTLALCALTSGVIIAAASWNESPLVAAFVTLFFIIGAFREPAR